MRITVPALGLITKVALIITLISVPLVIFVIHFNHRYQVEMEKRYPRCNIYFRDGSPYSVHIDDTVYQLREDGNFDPIDRVFLNPYHQEVINSGQCERIGN